MGKDKDNAGKMSGCLAGVRKRTGAGGWLGSFLISAMVACVLRAWGLVSVSVRSLTAHIAHTERVESTGHECEVMRGDAR